MIAPGRRLEAAPPPAASSVVRPVAPPVAPSAAPPPAPSSAPSEAPPEAPSSAPPAASVDAAADAPPTVAPPAAPPAAPTSAPAAAPPAEPSGPSNAVDPNEKLVFKKRPLRYTTWDLNLEGGAGYSWEGDNHVTGFGRIRGGLLHVNETDIQAPVFYLLGLTYEFSDFSPATFGLQGEFISLNTGAWFQAGAMIDVQPRPGFMASFGLSLIGAEAQVRWDENAGPFFVILGKLRLPIGIIALALKE
jgi:hypothetical protein